jgi:hypothetical protein
VTLKNIVPLLGVRTTLDWNGKQYLNFVPQSGIRSLKLEARRMACITGASLSRPASQVLDHIEEETFKEKIADLSRLDSREYPNSWELYTPLQRAVILGNVNECERLIHDGFDVNEEGAVCHHPLKFARRNEKIVDLLFPLSCAPSQAALLGATFIDGHIVPWERLWNLAHRAAKWMFFVTLYEIDNEQFDALFRSLPAEIQRVFLLFLSKTTSQSPKINDVIVKLFRSSFEKATPEIRNQQELGAILKEMDKRDEGFTEELTTCSLFGHRFSLKGELFEGLNIEQTSRVWRLIARSLESASRNENRFLQHSPKMISATVEVLDTDKSDPEVLSLRSLEKSSIVPCGWKGHSVVALFSKNIVVKINTARNSDGSPNGMAFYSINKTDKEVRTNAIKTLIQYDSDKVPAPKGFEYFTNTLSTQLDAELLAVIPFAQKSGNCVWSANKLAVLAHFILFDIEAEGKAVSKEAIDRSFRNVASAFDEWDIRDRMTSISETVPLLKKHPILFNLEQLKPQIMELFNPSNFGLLHQLEDN